jgi:hypothetical protein
MKALVLALYAEGPTDTRFLPPIIQRTAERIIAQYGQDIIDVLEPVIVAKQQAKRREECILGAAREACGYHALIVHSDADHRLPDLARSQRIQPGFDRVSQSNEKICKHLIPIIPVQMIEAWMLADHTALRETIGTDISPEKLGLPSRPALVELDANPKQTLKDVIQRSLSGCPNRRRRIDFNTRQETLGRRINLDTLNAVPSYRDFVLDLKKTLAEINFIFLR